MIISLFSSGGGGTYDVKLGVALPSVSSTGLVYDGTAKSPTIGSYSSDLMTVTYTPQTNAGTYTVQFSLKDKNKYAWLNTIDSADQYVQWSIAKANGTITASPASVEVGEGETKTVTVTTSQNTTIHATSNNTAVATVSVSGNTLSISDGGTEGTATITISADASSNYTYGTKTVAVVVEHLKIVTWADGTDAQIAKMCVASDQGKLNLYDYWNVGDERTVSLSAMSATGVGESHVAQNTIMVITNKGGYPITNGYCSAFIIQQKQCLSERGYINSSARNAGGWNSCARRTWCNNIYYQAIPNTLRQIFKEVHVKAMNGGNQAGTTLVTSNDYCFLPAEVEVINSRINAAWDEYSYYSGWDYYLTASNRKKGNNWWLRTAWSTDSQYWALINTSGDSSYNSGAANLSSIGIAPCGCIGTANDGTGTIIPSWSDGTDEQIVAAIASADAGKINLSDLWNIGDKRAINLSAMAATGVGESHRAQTVNLVLCDANNTNYPYVTPTSGRTYCNFVVQQENCLSSTDSGTTSDSERGYMNSPYTNAGGWNGCARRTWCNNVYRTAIPSTLRSIFKQVKVKAMNGGNQSGTTLVQSDDYFFLPAAKEIFYDTPSSDTYAYSNSTEWNALSTWKYYETTTNRVKKIGSSGAAWAWWERSPYRNNTNSFCSISSNGDGGMSSAEDTRGLAPCGCI